MDIKELIARRSDLSTFLVHLTRDYNGVTAKDNLRSILDDRYIEARNPYGTGASHLEPVEDAKPEDVETQKVFCFTETPLEHIHLLANEIRGRLYNFGPYGVAITKRLARRCELNPVWYLDITPHVGDDWLTRPLERLIDAQIDAGTFGQSDIAKLAPFIEQMGSSARYFKEFWWEREWRHVGGLNLAAVRKFIVICPEPDFDYVMGEWPKRPPFIDPDWSLEQIIGRLAGFEAEDIDPF